MSQFTNVPSFPRIKGLTFRKMTNFVISRRPIIKLLLVFTTLVHVNGTTVGIFGRFFHKNSSLYWKISQIENPRTVTIFWNKENHKTWTKKNILKQISSLRPTTHDLNATFSDSVLCRSSNANARQNRSRAFSHSRKLLGEKEYVNIRDFVFIAGTFG